MNSSRTLWMGNIESWMDESFVLSLFKSINVTPLKLNLRNKEQKKGCCFVEFDSPQTASNILKNYNGEKIKNFVMKLNWVNSHSKDKTDPVPNKKYTIYVGNLDKSIKCEELKNYFKEQFPSVISAKIIQDPVTQKSKGFGFVDFQNYHEYQYVLSNSAKTPRILGNNKLIINSAKLKKEEEASPQNINNSKNNSSMNELLPSNSSITEYIPMQMRNQEPLPPSKETNNNTNLSFVKSSMSTNTSFTISKCPQIEEGGGKEEEEDDFLKSLQKGFRDINNMFKNSYIKPYVSFQCNYYCNLNAYSLKDDNSYYHFGNQNNCSQFLERFSRQLQENEKNNEISEKKMNI